VPEDRPRLTTADLLRTSGVGALVWVSLTGFAGFALLLSSLPLWVSTGGASNAVAGAATTTATLAATVATQFGVPALVARWGIGPSLAGGLVLLGAPAPLYALTADPLAISGISVIRGVGFGLLTVIGSLLVARLAPPGAYGRTAGLYGAAIAVPNLFAVPGAVYLAQNVSFTLVFWLAALPLAGVPVALRYGAMGQRSVAGERAWHPDAARACLAPTTVLVVVTLAGGGLLTFVPIALADSAALAAAALFTVGAAAAVSRWWIGSVADQHGPAGLLLPMVLVTAAGSVVAAAGLAGGTHATPGRAVLVIAGALLAGTGYGAVQNLTLLVAFGLAGPQGSPTASTVWNAGFDTGTALGAFAVGAVAAVGPGLAGATALTALPVLAVLPVVLALRANPRARP